MRSMGTRRAALFAGVATVAAAALTGCSAGQVAETANKESSIYGVNTQNADGSVLIRGLAVTYGTVQGYPAGGSAPLELGLYNETAEPIRVTITSRPSTDGGQDVVAARSVGLTGGASAASTTPSATPSGVPAEAEPTGSRPAADKGGVGEPTPNTASEQDTAGPSAPATPTLAPTPSVGPTSSGAAVRPAELTLAPLSSQTFRPDDAESLQVVGLAGVLRAGGAVNLVFTFSNGVQPLTVQAPVGVPLSPIPRGSAENEGVGEGEES